MTVQLGRTGVKSAVRGAAPPRRRGAADQLRLDLIRVLIAMVLVVLGVAGVVGTGALVGAGVMPLEGPAPANGW
jgi:hypothetical protein